MAPKHSERHGRRLLSRRQMLKASLGVGAAAFLSACSPTEPTVAPTAAPAKPIAAPAATTAPTAAAAVKGEVRYYDWQLAQEPQDKLVADMLSQFGQKYPDVTVKQEPVAWADHMTKLVIQVQGATPPDAARIAEADVMPLAEMGALVPITGQQALAELAAVPDNVRQAVQYDGKDYLFIADATMDVLGWNTELFEQAGLDPNQPPKSWDELVTYAKKLTNKDKDQYGWGMLSDTSESSTRRVLQWMLSAGAELFSPDGKEVIINSPEGVHGLEFWANLALEHGVVPPGFPGASYQDVVTAYAQRKVAMWTCGPINISVAEGKSAGIKKATKLGAMPDPWRPPLRPTGYVVLAGGKNQRAAMALASYLGSKDMIKRWCLEGYVVPARSDVAAMPEFTSDPLLSAAAALVPKSVKAPQLHPMYAKISPQLNNALQSVLTKQATAKQALDTMAEKANAILKQG